MSTDGASTVERLAHWAHDLRREDIPGAVTAASRAQQRSILGGIAASVEDDAARRVLDAVTERASDGPAPLFGRGRTCSVEEAVYAASALSIALDFDDYVCFGHTGHSSVTVPLLLASETGSTADEQLVAQVAANEIEARIGGACLIGPLNGQMWSFIHCAGAAITAARLLGLSRSESAHALAIALYQAPRPTVPGFMAPDSKLLTASEPALIGLRAARLARAGVTGPLDVLDHRHGFLAAFSYAPLRGMFDGLGEGWATRTLCVKPYPGCAYIDTTIDALLSLGPIDASSIGAVQVDASALTCGMDALSNRYSDVPTPVTVNFSIAWTVAIALLAGRLTPDEVNAKWLADHHGELASLAARVTLNHDVSLTRRSLQQMNNVIPPRTVMRDVGVPRLLAGLRRMRADHPRVRLGPKDLTRVAKGARRGLRTGGRGGYWSPPALERFEMSFPARVRVRTKTGRELTAEADVPRGGAGNTSASPESVADSKLAAWGPRLWGADGTDALRAAIDGDAALQPLLG